MSEFRGLHNPERHRLLSDGTTFCDDSDEDVETYWGCIEDCYPDDPCRCCLAAEVEALRAQVQRVRELHAPCLDPEVHNGDRCCLVCSDHGRRGEYTLWPCLTIRALDGDA